MVASTVISNGLDGIVVAETEISEVDGDKGRLIIRGKDAEELAFASTFEETCLVLWCGPDALERGKDIDHLRKCFGLARLEAYELLKGKPFILTQKNPMDAIRTATSFLTGDTRAGIDEFAKLTAAVAVFAANWLRLKEGLPIVTPDPELSHSADFLRMLRGENAPAIETQGLDTYLTTVSDHGMNASTFTARVVASTDSDNVSCVVAAIGALKGPLHGGAPGPVLEMLDAIGTAGDAEKWLTKELDAGKRIMGMGHRIYKVRDPRAAIFERAIKRLEDAGVPARRLALARAVEKKAEELLARRHPEKPLKANVEFYTAVLLDALAIPKDLFTSVFAVGRVGGWCAHIAEQRRKGRLIRPASRYCGPRPPN